jgi:hypothetical protein
MNGKCLLRIATSLIVGLAFATSVVWHGTFGFEYSYLNRNIIMAIKKVFEGRREHRKGLDFFRSD